MIDVKAIRARADAATAGPWKHSPTELWACVATPTHLGRQVASVACADDRPDQRRATAAFIAAARTDVPALCDEVERLRAAVREVVPVLDRAVSAACAKVPPDYAETRAALDDVRAALGDAT